MWLIPLTLLSLRVQPSPVSVIEANARFDTIDIEANARFDTSGTRWVYTELTKYPQQKRFHNMANSFFLCSLQWLP